MQWFYIRNEQRIGPIEEAQLFQLAREGGLSPDDLVWNPTMGEQWNPASTIPDLFAAPPSAAPATPGTTENRLLMQQSLLSLRGKWAVAIGATLLYQVIISGINFIPYAGGIAVLIIAGPMAFGFNRFFLRMVRREPADVGRLFDGFKMFGKTVATYLLMTLFISLWGLLIIFPTVLTGAAMILIDKTPALAIVLAPLLVALFILALLPAIRASLGYSQAFYLLSDQPGLGAMEALRESQGIMEGFKWKFFCLGFRFAGWALLSLFTCFIGFLWLYPYMMASYAHFYDDVRVQ